MRLKRVIGNVAYKFQNVVARDGYNFDALHLVDQIVLSLP